MKIGILTYHAACNFGANLQALSTVDYFLGRGDDVVVINFLPDELERYYEKRVPHIQYEEHRKFRESLMPLTKRCRNEDDVAKVIEREGIEAVLVGSDAVMQHHPLLSRICFSRRHFIYIDQLTKDRMCPNPFWGSFLPLLEQRIPICFMSASSQNSPYQLSTCKEKAMMRMHLERFSYISTRDDWTANMVLSLTHGRINPIITPDPVFAFNHNVIKQPSEEEIRKRFDLTDKYFVLSFLSSRTVSVDWLKNLECIAEKDGITCVALPFPNGVKYNHPFDKEISLPLSPLDWYALIKYSEGYIGHNMHPIVIALHNSVPCFSFDQYGIVKYHLFRNEKSSKIYHIMNEFGVLENRISDIGAFKTTPTPEFVYGKLKSFDKNAVAKHAEHYLQRYLEMMNSIESVIRS